MYAHYCWRCHKLAKAGDRAGLLQSREEGCPWDQENGYHRHRDLCCGPAAAGDLATLAWLREQGCPDPYWDLVIASAARMGRTNVVSWACAQGFAMNKSAALGAAIGGHLQTLQCLLAAGCPWDPEKCRQMACWEGHEEVAAWVEWSMSPDEPKNPGEPP